MTSFYVKSSRSFLAGNHVPLPRHLTIELTSCCNLRCRMCPKTNGSVNTPENKIMTWEIFERLIPLLPHIESLDLTGVWGEAFLHPKLYVDMLKIIKANGSDVYTISNGTLLTDDLARQLVEHDLNKLTISLDAATAETYAFVRPPGRFEDVLNGLASLNAWKKKLGRSQPRLELAFVGMKSNIGEFPRAVQLAVQLGAYRICLQAMGEYPGLENESVATHHKDLGRRLYEEGLRLGRELGVLVELQPPDQFEEDRKEHNVVDNQAGRRKQCYDLWNRALISANGDVLPCCASPTSMGNLKDASFAEIWRGPAYNGLRRAFLTGKIPEMCRQCTGTSWVEKTVRRDLQFFFGSLLLPRAKRRIKFKLKEYKALRWVKRQLDRARGREISK
jgi:radical SAM protein with 4Fe4S-binding SPASM domain